MQFSLDQLILSNLITAFLYTLIMAVYEEVIERAKSVILKIEKIERVEGGRLIVEFRAKTNSFYKLKLQEITVLFAKSKEVVSIEFKGEVNNEGAYARITRLNEIDNMYFGYIKAFVKYDDHWSPVCFVRRKSKEDVFIFEAIDRRKIINNLIPEELNGKDK